MLVYHHLVLNLEPLWQQYHLEKEAKQETSAKPVEAAKEVAPEVTTTQAEEVSEDQAKEESPAEEAVSAVEENTEATSEEVPAAAEEEEAPPAAEETNEEDTSEQVPEETPDEIKVYILVGHSLKRVTYFDVLCSSFSLD